MPLKNWLDEVVRESNRTVTLKDRLLKTWQWDKKVPLQVCQKNRRWDPCTRQRPRRYRNKRGTTNALQITANSTGIPSTVSGNICWAQQRRKRYSGNAVISVICYDLGKDDSILTVIRNCVMIESISRAPVTGPWANWVNFNAFDICLNDHTEEKIIIWLLSIPSNKNMVAINLNMIAWVK